MNSLENLRNIYKLINSLHFPTHLSLREIKTLINSEEYTKAREKFSKCILKNIYNIPHHNLKDVMNVIEYLKKVYFLNSSRIGFYDFAIMPNLRTLQTFILSYYFSESTTSVPFFTYELLHFPSDPLSNVEHRAVLYPTIIAEESADTIKIYNEVPIVSDKNSIHKVAGNKAIGYIRTVLGKSLLQTYEKIIFDTFKIKPCDFSDFVKEFAKRIEEKSNSDANLNKIEEIYVITDDGNVSKYYITSFKEAEMRYSKWRPSASFYYPLYISNSPTNIIYDTLDVNNTDKGLEKRLNFLSYCSEIPPVFLQIAVVSNKGMFQESSINNFLKLLGIYGGNSVQLSLIDYKYIFSTSLLNQIKDRVEESIKNRKVENNEEITKIIIEATNKILEGKRIKRFCPKNSEEVKEIIKSLFE